MVYKRYIKRGDKLFGTYYYKSYRDETGRTRTKLVKVTQKNKLPYLIVFLLILTAGFFILNKNFDDEQKTVINPEKASFLGPKIIGSFIKLIGFDISDEPEDESNVNENVEE